MIDVIVKLLAIYHYAKDIHYHATGETFYSTHLLMDRICNGIHDQIDAINEVAYLGQEREAPLSADTLKVATAILPPISKETQGNLARHYAIVSSAIESIDEAKEYEPGGVVSLLDDIQKTLLQKKGLIGHTSNAYI